MITILQHISHKPQEDNDEWNANMSMLLIFFPKFLPVKSYLKDYSRPHTF